MRSYKNDLYGCDPYGTVYLDHAASTLSFKKCVGTGLEFLADYGSIHRGAGYNSEISTERFEQARKEIEEDLKCGEEASVIFTANTTDGINRFALLYPFKTGDEVLISDVEHSSNTLPWVKRAKTVTIPSNENFDVTPEAVEKALNEHPHAVIVALAASSNITGNHIDWSGIYAICKAHKVLFFMDASQLAPHERVTMEMADVIAYCGPKLYAPFGSGILAGPTALLSHAGFAPTGGGNVLYVYPDNTPIYKKAPFMHEAGTANGIGAVTLGEAHRILYHEYDQNELEMHNKELLLAMKKAGETLRENHYNVWFTDRTEHRSPIMVIDNQIKTNQETVKLLNLPMEGQVDRVFVREGAFCAYRIVERLKPELSEIKDKIVHGELNHAYSLIRLSAGLGTDPEDIEKAVRKLVRINLA